MTLVAITKAYRNSRMTFTPIIIAVTSVSLKTTLYLLPLLPQPSLQLVDDLLLHSTVLNHHILVTTSLLSLLLLSLLGYITLMPKTLITFISLSLSLSKLSSRFGQGHHRGLPEDPGQRQLLQLLQDALRGFLNLVFPRAINLSRPCSTLQ